MNLLIDWGNTQLKAVLVESFEAVISQPNELKSVSLESPAALVDWLKAQSPPVAVDNILIASVRNNQQTQYLVELLESFSKRFSIAETSEFRAGVQCAYDNPNNLGIDRWLGLLASYNKRQTTAVIDIGSAITVDVVNSLGHHLGGQIIPGMRLIKDSLNKTGKVLAEQREELQESFRLGVTTGECVDFGVSQLVESYLKNIIFELTSRYQINNWIFTGGGGLYWIKRLQRQKDIIDQKNSKFLANIVFTGLVIDFLEKTDSAQYIRD